MVRSGSCDWNRISALVRKENGGIMIPKDPAMLLSYVNMKLRDQYEDLEDLCDDLAIDRKDLEEQMASINYYYQEKEHQFK